MAWIMSDKDFKCLETQIREIRTDITQRRIGLLKQRTGPILTILLNAKWIDDAQLRKNTD